MDSDLEEWREADTDGVEGLSKTEFLSFRHPEHSGPMLEGMVNDIFRSMDKDGNGKVTEDEFAAVPEGQLEDNDDFKEMENSYLNDRRKEFREAIDLDKNGFATKDELLSYSNPRNPQHARQEVKDLMDIADENNDGFLDLDEIFSHKNIFLGSGLVNPARNMHDEM